MDIKNCTNAINAYQAIGGTKFETETKKSDEIKKKKNTDKLELSSSKNTLEGVKASIVKNAEASASPERIAALTAAVSEGKYSVSSESIANSILSTEA